MCNTAPDSSPSELLLPDCVRFSCCSPIALIRFNCCSPFASASAAARHLCLLQLLLPDCVRFNCSPIASASAVAPRLRPPQVQLLLRLHLQLPDCVRFGCCSPIASASTAAPRLHPLNACSLTSSGRFQPMPNVLERSPRSSRFSKLKYEGRASLV